MDYRILKAAFQLPDNGIPMIVEWDEENQVLQFDVEDYSYAVECGQKEAADYAVKWAMRHSINCDTENQANGHLRCLGINETLDEW